MMQIITFVAHKQTMFKRINWDALGISASIICAIHCAVLPVFLTSLPLLGVNIIHNAGFELGMIVTAFSIGANALYHGYKKHHKNVLPLLLFAGGMLFLVAKQVWHNAELWLLLPAVAFIVTGHLINYRLCYKAGH
jgi:hypothetical protein